MSTLNAADSPTTGPQITILLCTYNGALFLTEQLASIAAQTYQNWRLVVSDDGSQDGTLEILRSGFIADSKIEIRYGPQLGACKNYMSLVTDGSIKGDYFAFCDQDDVWGADKLQRAVDQLGGVSTEGPALYFSRMQLIAADGHHLGLSRRYKRPPSFENALVENIASGNTIVMNRQARDLLVQAGDLDVAMHDWWAYMLITGAGGTLCYDELPSMLYRQHQVNAIGIDTGFRAVAKRFQRLWSLSFAEKTAMNVAALQSCRHLLRAENRFILDFFLALRSSSAVLRLISFRRARVYRQNILDQASLIFAVAMKLV